MGNLIEFKEKLIDEIELVSLDSQFVLKPANEWIEDLKVSPIPKMLIGSFWYEGEVCIFFVDTNIDKSILEVQIGESIASGKSTGGMGLEIDVRKVLYFYFELSDKQFENRYSLDYKEQYKFPSNFHRSEINTDFACKNLDDFEAQFLKSLDNEIMNDGYKIIIIDNLTFLRKDTENAKDALSFMIELKALNK